MAEESRLILDIEHLKGEFSKTTDRLIKDIKRHDKIMARTDRDQMRELKKLEARLEEVEALQEAQKNLLDAFIKLIASAIDAKSKYTGGHCSRVPHLSMMLVKEASLSENDVFKDFKLDTLAIRCNIDKDNEKEYVQLREKLQKRWNNDKRLFIHPAILQDFNSGNNEGMGYFPFTVKNGFRCSTSVGYLNPIKKRKNFYKCLKKKQYFLCCLFFSYILC